MKFQVLRQSSWSSPSQILQDVQTGFHRSMHVAQARDNPPLPLRILVWCTIVVAVICLAKKHIQKNRCTTAPPTPVLDKGKHALSRTPGVWTPSTYRLPTPTPYPDWSITSTQPLPYRPFRYGPKYVQTMGLRTVKADEWIELDNEFPKYHAYKVARIAGRGDRCCKTAPEAYPAAMELLEDLVNYLPARYPSLFRRTPDGIENLCMGETVLMNTSEDPIQACARLVQDDLAIMIERPDGEYYLLSGAILLPGFWRLEDKFGMTLSSIHTSGDVPDFESKLEKGMKNLFRRMQPEKMVGRNNYFFQLDDNLAWSFSIGSEDDRGIGWFTATEGEDIEQLYFRSERQTLRRLPRSGGVVFTIRTYFMPVVEIAKEKGVSGRLASAVRSWGDGVVRYKGGEKYNDLLLKYLDKRHEEDTAEYGIEEMKRVESEWSGYPF